MAWINIPNSTTKMKVKFVTFSSANAHSLETYMNGWAESNPRAIVLDVKFSVGAQSSEALITYYEGV
jgi:hypothetical protein